MTAESGKRAEGARRRRRNKAVGAPPGHLPPQSSGSPASIRVFDYGQEELVELHQPPLDSLRELIDRPTVTWIDVVGIEDVAILRTLADTLSLHGLAVEDVATPHQRAKVEDYGDRTFLVLRMLSNCLPDQTEQLSVFVGPRFVATFQERDGDCWEEVRNRLRAGKGRLRTSGPGYLAYALLDAIVDAYFPELEKIGDRIEELEDAVSGDLDDGIVAELYGVRRKLLVLRRALWPLREATAALVRGEMPAFGPELRPWLRDVHDHVVQLLDLLENYREMASSLMEVHLTGVSLRLNQVMKVLTVIATIFIPLTFVVGVYGMNFAYMPELHWTYGYPAVWALMIAMALAMLWWFRRHRWI
ncbi:MAG: magnesium/cobalt transporter CorA [Planctomycetota bacterium]